jgi:hypothetical protein
LRFLFLRTAPSQVCGHVSLQFWFAFLWVHVFFDHLYVFSFFEKCLVKSLTH